MFCIVVEVVVVKGGEDLLVLNVFELFLFVDIFFFVIGNSECNVVVIVDEIEDKLIEFGYKCVCCEGCVEVCWVLLDFGDLIVYVFY